jgi:hypothetical protein
LSVIVAGDAVDFESNGMTISLNRFGEDTCPQGLDSVNNTLIPDGLTTDS